MALEQLTNNATSTTTGAIDGVTNPVSLTVASAASFPTAGNFRIIVDSELMLVTAVAGAVFTCTRAQEGTTIASHLSGAAVTHVLTAASFKQLVSEYHLADTHANRPAAGVAGRLFFPTDGGLTFRDSGSVWQAWVNGYGPFEPPLADFTTWVNQSSATFSTAGNVASILWAGANLGSENLNQRVKSLTGFPTWKFTAAFTQLMPPGSNGNLGLCLRNSTNGRIWGHTVLQSGGSFNGYQWSSSTAYSGTNTHSDAMGNFLSPLQMLRLRYDGTNLHFENSLDFVTWCTNRSYVLSASYLAGADQVGYYFNGFNGRSGQTGGISMYHAKLES